jgi:hypothetical protein
MTEKKLKYINDIKNEINILNYNSDLETLLTRPKCDNFTVNEKIYTCNKKQSLNYSEYITNPSQINLGYSNLNNFSLLKFGESSRLNNKMLRDIDNDRIYLTHKNFQTSKYISSLPEDTRHLNKKYFL